MPPRTPDETGVTPMYEDAYEGMSLESFEDACANALADVPGTNVPRSYHVRLGYSVGGITPPQYVALLTPLLSLQEA